MRGASEGKKDALPDILRVQTARGRVLNASALTVTLKLNSQEGSLRRTGRPLSLSGLHYHSVVAFLEQSIADLQAEAEEQNSLSTLPSSTCDYPSSAVRDRFLSILRNCMSYDSGKSIRGQSTIIYRDVLLAGSAPPRTVHAPTADQDSSYSTLRMSLDDIPPSVAETLVNIYVEKILPHSGLFVEDEIHQLYRRACIDGRASGQREPQDLFMILMVFAISTMCSKCDDFHRPVSLAESLHAEAIQYFDCSTSSTTTLQCLLLAIQLAYVLPDTGNVEILVAEAMRMAVELGLHTVSLGGHSNLTDRPQRLFWQVSRDPSSLFAMGTD